MAILDEMKSAKEEAERERPGIPHVWLIGDALHAVQAGLKDEPSFPLVPGALLLGFPWEGAAEGVAGWELVVADD